MNVALGDVEPEEVDPNHMDSNDSVEVDDSVLQNVTTWRSSADVVQPSLSSDVLVDFDFDDLVLHIYYKHECCTWRCGTRRGRSKPRGQR